MGMIPREADTIEWLKSVVKWVLPSDTIYKLHMHSTVMLRYGGIIMLMA